MSHEMQPSAAFILSDHRSGRGILAQMPEGANSLDPVLWKGLKRLQFWYFAGSVTKLSAWIARYDGLSCEAKLGYGYQEKQTWPRVRFAPAIYWLALSNRPRRRGRCEAER
jgi:hypothetical protein